MLAVRAIGLVALMFTFPGTVSWADAITPAPKDPSGAILILLSRNPNTGWPVPELDGMLREFQETEPALTPAVEFMDWPENSGALGEKKLLDYYQTKFAKRRFRVVITAGQPALSFVQKSRNQIFPGTEVVFCGVSDFDATARPDWLTGITEWTDAAGTFRLARLLQPGLRRMLIVGDPSHPGQETVDQIREKLPVVADRVDFEFLDIITAQDLFQTVESLPPDSAVLLIRGQFTPTFAKELRARCPVPTYGLRTPMHLPGILGGSLVDGHRHGEAAAKTARAILAGLPAKQFPIKTDIPHRLVVNYEQMARFGFDLDALPAGTEVLDRPQSFWEKNRRVLIIGSGIIAVLISAVVTLCWLLRQKRAAAWALKRSLSTLNTTFESISDGLLVVDASGRVANFNEHFRTLWQVPPGTGAQQGIEQFMCAITGQVKQPATLLERLGNFEKPRGKTTSDVIEFEDGRVFEHDSRLFEDGGKIAGRVSLFRDVTARLRAENERHQLVAQLADAQKMEAIGTLAGGIAHDFNNILVGVIGYAELARARLPETHPSAEDLTHVLNAGERARDLVRQILNFSRKRRVDKQVVSLRPIVRETLRLIRAAVPATIDIRAHLEHDADCALADPAQIHQALLNLATNAVQAMGAGPGCLTVSLERVTGSAILARTHPILARGAWVRLTVRDTGQGMDKETMRRVFEPFYTTKAPTEGTGLGLAVVHGIVEALGGAITVESLPNQGSSFRVFFPIAEHPLQTAPLPPPAIPAGHGERVLIVEDETSVAEVARNYLTSLGYRITVCNTPESAIEEIRIHAKDYSAVLTDFSMPRMSGLELIRQLHGTQPGLPCVLCTGYMVSIATEQEATSLGVRDIVPKPFTPQSLGTAVSRAIGGDSSGHEPSRN